jgi:exopolysaccharide biosynthesis operon protein EpsL
LLPEKTDGSQPPNTLVAIKRSAGLSNMRLNAAVAAMLLLGSVGYASADPEDSWNVIAGTQVMQDSNLFRLPEGHAVSDRITATNLGAHVNKAYSLQRFVVDGMVTDLAYDKNSYLNHLAKKGSAAWLWSVTPSLHGNLSAQYDQALYNFADYQRTQKNLRTIQTYRFDAEWEAIGRLHLTGGVNHTELKNSQVIDEDGDNRVDSLEYGLKYVLPSGSNFALVQSQGNGEYMNRTPNPFSLLDNGFTQSTSDARVTWVVSDKTLVNLKLGRVERNHDHYSQRDYSGTTGLASIAWTPLAKLRIDGSWRQEYASFQTYESSYFRRRTWNVSPVWQIGAKLALRGSAAREQREYLGEIIPVLAGREDKITTNSLALEWSPMRTVTLSLTAQDQRRSSNRAHLDFASRMYGVTGMVNF